MRRMKKVVIIGNGISGITAARHIRKMSNYEITVPVRAYFKALNASNKSAVMSQYSKEPIFMRQGAPAFIGRDAINQAYTEVFKLLELDIELEILEVEKINDNTALVRTHSKGQVHIKPKNLTIKEGNNELFILKLEEQGWKIHRYIFSNDYTRKSN